jgi:hypothetical protein
MLKKCPYSGVQFLPKRKNQIFATSKNRRDYHNEVAAKLRSVKSPIDNMLSRNFNILSEFVPNGKMITFDKEYLLSKGYNPKVFTHLEFYNDKTCPCLYHFVIVPSQNSNQIIIFNSIRND